MSSVPRKCLDCYWNDLCKTFEPNCEWYLGVEDDGLDEYVRDLEMRAREYEKIVREQTDDESKWKD